MTPVVVTDIDELSDRAILLRTYTLINNLGVQVSAIADAVAATQAAVDQLKVDIAQEIQQVTDALAASADIPAAVTQLNAITTQLTEQSTALQADNPPA